MRQFVRRVPFQTFYLLAWVVALGVMAAYYAVGLVWDPSVLGLLDDLAHWLARQHAYTSILGIGRYAAAARRPIALLIFLYAAAPTISALIVTAAVSGGAGVRRLLQRHQPWCAPVRPADVVPWYVVIVAGHLALVAGYLWMMHVRGPASAADQAWRVLGGSVPAAAGVSLLGLFVDEGGTLEELGWRGFALPRLVDRLGSPLAGAIVLGLLWAAWHLPELLPYAVAHPTGAWTLTLAGFFLMCAADTVVMTFFYYRTGGSVLPAIMIHASWNFRSKALASPFEPRLWLVLGAALLTLLLAGPRLGQPRQAAGGALGV
jgi:membrane protease YdiL (CAAX protease family)